MKGGKCGEYGWESEEWDGNAGAENQRRNSGNLGGNAKNMANHGSDVGNQGGYISLVVEMTQYSNENEKFKEWREVKIVENEHICKNLVSRI